MGPQRRAAGFVSHQRNGFHLGATPPPIRCGKSGIRLCFATTAHKSAFARDHPSRFLPIPESPVPKLDCVFFLQGWQSGPSFTQDGEKGGGWPGTLADRVSVRGQPRGAVIAPNPPFLPSRPPTAHESTALPPVLPPPPPGSHRLGGGGLVAACQWIRHPNPHHAEGPPRLLCDQWHCTLAGGRGRWGPFMAPKHTPLRNPRIPKGYVSLFKRGMQECIELLWPEYASLFLFP